MKMYFLHDGTQQTGPYTKLELKLMEITQETFVWCEGMTDWQKAGEISDLKDLFEPVAPHTNPTYETKAKAIETKKKSTMWLTIFSIVILLAIVAFIVIKNSTSSHSNGGGEDGSYTEKVQSIEEIESDNPLQFLSASGTYKENVMGTKFKVKCEISNSASVVTYKDLVIRVTYYTKTKTEIGSEEHTLYETFKPNSTKTIDLKVNNYSDVDAIGWDVISASVY